MGQECLILRGFFYLMTFPDDNPWGGQPRPVAGGGPCWLCAVQFGQALLAVSQPLPQPAHLWGPGLPHTKPGSEGWLCRSATLWLYRPGGAGSIWPC